MRTKVKTILKITFSFSLLFILYYKIGFVKVSQTIRTLDLKYIPLIILIYITIHVINAIALKIFFHPVKKIKFRNMIKYYLSSFAVSLIIPGKLGELSIAYFLKKEDISIGVSGAVAIIDKIITLIIWSIFCVIGLLSFFELRASIKAILILISVIIILIFSISSETSRRIVKKYILKSYSQKFKGFSKTLKRYVRYHKKYIILNLGLTVVKLSLGALFAYFLLIATRNYLDLLTIMIIVSIVSIISLIPIAINGIGVKETLGIFMYGLVGIPGNVVLTIYILGLVLAYLSGIIIFLFVRNKN